MNGLTIKLIVADNHHEKISELKEIMEAHLKTILPVDYQLEK